MERHSTHRGESELVEHMVSSRQGIFHAGRIEGQTVSDVCLDTGCSQTMVRQDLAPAALVTTKLGETKTALAVVTRARAKAQEREEASDWLREEESGVCPRSLEPEEEVRLPEFDADLFVAGREKVKLTRSQKRAQREEHPQKQGVEAMPERLGLEMSARKLIDLQDD